MNTTTNRNRFSDARRRLNSEGLTPGQQDEAEQDYDLARDLYLAND